MTKRSALFAAATASLMTVGVVAPAMAAAPEKVTVCHVIPANVSDSNNSFDWQIGREISVSSNAVDGLVARGDGVKGAYDHSHYMNPGHEWWGFLTDYDGRLVNADCAFR